MAYLPYLFNASLDLWRHRGMFKMDAEYVSDLKNIEDEEIDDSGTKRQYICTSQYAQKVVKILRMRMLNSFRFLMTMSFT